MPPTVSSPFDVIPIGTRVRIKSREELAPYVNTLVRAVLFPQSMLSFAGMSTQIMEQIQGSHTIVYKVQGCLYYNWVPEWFDIVPTVTPKGNILKDMNL